MTGENHNVDPHIGAWIEISAEIEEGKIVQVLPSWMPASTAKPVNARVVYIHPEERYYAVEYAIDTADGDGKTYTVRFRECFKMVPHGKLCSIAGNSSDPPVRTDYDE